MTMCPLRFTGIRNPDAPGMDLSCQGNKCSWWAAEPMPGATGSFYEDGCCLRILTAAMAIIARQASEFMANR